jgi:hypothetical protein
LRDFDVIGDRWIAGAVTGAVAAGAGVGAPAAAPPVVTAIEGAAAANRNVKLPRNVLRVRTRKTTTSFVGLRG